MHYADLRATQAVRAMYARALQEHHGLGWKAGASKGAVFN
jgi:hypothetical protein